jgi:sigma-B regulation protein RsbU (phosphoserine phosphatase)
MESAAAHTGPAPASLVVIDPNGHRMRVALAPLPFRIGRQADNDLVLRDSRASRLHARISSEDNRYLIEDAGSRHGTFVNGKRIQKYELKNSDKIEFGVEDSYQLVFALDGAELKRLMEQVAGSERDSAAHGVGSHLGKLRAILDLARTLQSSFSIDDVLASVVDTALAITGSERGFLLLRSDRGLETRAARHRDGRRLHETDLRVPRDLIHRALEHRRDLLSMNFDPIEGDETRPRNTIADLELRSVICVPLVRIRTGLGDATSVVSAARETVGVLYMDSRRVAADLTGGNRELLQTLAIEASTVLENARLLEEERSKQQLEEELNLARAIQQSLLPKALPADGWLRASGSSMASHQVGGDYFDVTEVTRNCWSAIVADVSGKGVSSALLASLLQGALLTATDHPEALTRRIERLNQFLIGRTGGEKYATVFHGVLHRDGMLYYVNAAHCPPLLVRAGGPVETLEATAPPVGLVEDSKFPFAEQKLADGQKLVIYSDGVTESQSTRGDFFGRQRLHETVMAHAQDSCAVIHDAIQKAVTAFTEGAPQADDITLLVLEYRV